MSSDEAFGWRITDEEWREFQAIPDQGFSHRSWVDCRLQQRVEWQAERDAVRIAALEAEVEQLRMLVPPCDGGCSYGDGPQEDCSAHGRRPAELWEIIQQEAAKGRDAQYQAEAAEAKLAAVRAVCVARTEEYPDDPYDFVREFALDMLAVLDGGDET